MTPTESLHLHHPSVNSIEDLNDVFNTYFSDKEVDTISDLVMQAFSHSPARGKVIAIDSYNFKAAMADILRII